MATMIVLSAAERIRFEKKIERTETCWLWTAGSSTFGHGRFKVSGKLQSTHRIAYCLANGSIPEAKLVLHKCHNPACVNPKHLYAGTHADNMNDALAAGRAKLPPITRILSEQKAKEIKRLLKEDLSYREIARRTGVNHRTVSSIKNNRVKAWVDL